MSRSLPVVSMNSVLAALVGWTAPAFADLPFGRISPESLRPASLQISFDPLALLAVLHNARAASSAVRLYNQPNPGVYRWPHTMMIGGTLAPFKLLVDHLVSQRKSIHPAMEMCKADIGDLAVKTDFTFSALPISGGNFWLADIMGYSSSETPQNDLVIVHLDNIQGALETGAADNKPSVGLKCFWLEVISLATGISILAGFVCSVLGGDMWSTVLFFTYVLHWMASVVVSYRSMITARDVEDRRVNPDATRRHALYQRSEGGKIVFVGRQDTLETWARTTYGFNRTAGNNRVHWLWMISGSLCATASVVCMVNMAGWFQLAWLGVLSLSSLGEILITILVRHIQNTAIHYGSVCNILKSNETWSEAIIRSALLVEDKFSLAGLDWVAFGRLPDYPVFRNLCDLLPRIRADCDIKTEADVLTALMQNQDKSRRPLAERLTREISETLWQVPQQVYIDTRRPAAADRVAAVAAARKDMMGRILYMESDSRAID